MSCQARYLRFFRQELLTFKSLPPSDFIRHSKKIVTLIEISRTRLIESHIPMSKQVVCTPGHEPYRATYIQLLEALQCRQWMIEDIELRGRVKRLLLPLACGRSVASGSIKITGGPIDKSLPTTSQTGPLLFHPYKRAGASTLRARSETPGRDASMPPPDELPPLLRKSKASDRKIFNETTILDAPQDCTSGDKYLSEYSVAVTLRGRSKGKFGIFCTNKRR
ncbi:hypothetical protein OE88DRAFT_567599 [Heliocybe sulcata]|uniref:Uncharacterized protein n=1 Tax=Heliocybe sulcata TaxID=5364 RepID=A0A5C3N3C7_9AGAM|nr:hypothetical protein OE88DRAFT_567599 [Heliocybe sulcata]